MKAALSGRIAEPVKYFPSQDHACRELRAQQAYLAKVPVELLEVLKELAA